MNSIRLISILTLSLYGCTDAEPVATLAAAKAGKTPQQRQALYRRHLGNLIDRSEEHWDESMSEVRRLLLDPLTTVRCSRSPHGAFGEEFCGLMRIAECQTRSSAENSRAVGLRQTQTTTHPSLVADENASNHCDSKSNTCSRCLSCTTTSPNPQTQPTRCRNSLCVIQPARICRQSVRGRTRNNKKRVIDSLPDSRHRIVGCSNLFDRVVCGNRGTADVGTKLKALEVANQSPRDRDTLEQHKHHKPWT